MLLAVATVKESIDAANKALSTYDEFVVRVVPAKELKESLDELDKYRNDFSKDIALLFTEVRTRMMDGLDTYFYASQHIYEWASSTATQLKLYVKLFNGHDIMESESQQKLLIEMLGGAAEQLRAAQTNLDKSVSSFYAVAEKLTALRNRFGPHFYERNKDFQSEMGVEPVFLLEWADTDHVRNLMNKMGEIMKICDNLFEKSNAATFGMIYAEKLLLKSIKLISNLKTMNQQRASLANLEMSDRNMLVKLAQDLITKCEEYRTEHSQKSNLR